MQYQLWFPCFLEDSALEILGEKKALKHSLHLFVSMVEEAKQKTIWQKKNNNLTKKGGSEFLFIQFNNFHLTSLLWYYIELKE